MFASTNLFIELGIVLVILAGWQFDASEFVGGPICALPHRGPGPAARGVTRGRRREEARRDLLARLTKGI
jgi:hypothetical protein